MPKLFTGIVTSDAADKTITVSISSRETHPIYGKSYTVNRKYMAHDEGNIAKKGDKVTISETRPFSKRKSFKLDAIVEKSHGSIQLKDNDLEALLVKPSKDESVTEKPAEPKTKRTSPTKLQDEVLEDKEG